MTPMLRDVLIIEDDRDLCMMLTEYLGGHGYKVVAVHRGEDGLRSCQERSWDLILLDVMLPGIDGFEVMRKLRAASSIPVLLLTARGDEVDRIVGLELGADDYLPKPFNVRELVARMRAILRRQQRNIEAASLQADSGYRLRLDEQERRVTYDANEISLTDVEYRVLELLVRAAGTTVTREEIVRHSHGRHLRPFDRSLDMHLSRLRRKLEAAGMPTDLLRTVRGEGYLLLRPSGMDR